jgi:hypothetical protein
MKLINSIAFIVILFLFGFEIPKSINTDIPPSGVKFSEHSFSLSKAEEINIRNIITNFKTNSKNSNQAKYIWLLSSSSFKDWQRNHKIGFLRMHLINEYICQNSLWERDKIIFMEPKQYSSSKESVVYIMFTEFN